MNSPPGFGREGNFCFGAAVGRRGAKWTDVRRGSGLPIYRCGTGWSDNIDDWLLAISFGRGIGISRISTAETYQHSGVVYRPLIDAPPVTVSLAWLEPVPHPAVPELVEFMGAEGCTDVGGC